MNDSHSEQNQPPVEVPFEALSPESLAGVIDDFILREGTDYGAAEIAIETKRDRILKQLKKGDVTIVFDPNRESITILSRTEWRKLQASL